MKLMNFKINAKSEGTMKTVVRARQFELILDEPEHLGGKDEGANPLEFVLASLAGCYTVVGSFAAKELGFELREMNMEIEGTLNPGRFSGQSYDDRAGFKEITIRLKVDADADAENLKKWIGIIEDRCPVTDNLTNKTPLKISVEKV